MAMMAFCPNSSRRDALPWLDGHELHLNKGRCPPSLLYQVRSPYECFQAMLSFKQHAFAQHPCGRWCYMGMEELR